MCRETGRCVIETINLGVGGKPFVLNIELWQRRGNRFCMGMTDIRNKSVENTNRIRSIKSDPLKENKGDLSLTYISSSMKMV